MSNKNNHGGVRENQGRPQLKKVKTLVTHFKGQESTIREFIENLPPQKFLNKCKGNNDVTGMVVHTSTDDYWDYFVQIVGFLNGKYFSIVFSSRNKQEKKEIAQTTEDVEKFINFVDNLK